MFSFGNYGFWLFPDIGQTWRRDIRSHTLGFLQTTSGDELWWPQPSKAFTFSLRICLVCHVLPQVMNSILPDTWHRWADPARGRDRQHEWTCYQTSNQVQVTQLSLLLVHSKHRWSPWTRHGRDATRTTDLMFPVRSGNLHTCAHTNSFSLSWHLSHQPFFVVSHLQSQIQRWKLMRVFWTTPLRRQSLYLYLQPICLLIPKC